MFIFNDENIQQRNFQNQKEHSRLHVHQNNIAQIISSHDSGIVDCQLAMILLNDELEEYNRLNTNKDFDEREQKWNLSSFINQSEKKSSKTFESRLTSEYVSKFQYLQQSKHSSERWLLEVQNNPSLSLVKTLGPEKAGIVPREIDHQFLSGFDKKSCNENSPSFFSANSSHVSSRSSTLLNEQRETKRKYEENPEEASPQPSCFKSAREQLVINQKKKFQRTSPQGTGPCGKKSLGSRPRNQCFAKFIPPSSKDNCEESGGSKMLNKSRPNSSMSNQTDEAIHPKLKGIEPQLIELVMSEIMDHGPPIGWDDIAGLEFAKATIKEIVIWPMLRPDIFTGLRGPPKGILLFGPPGTGKTLIGKCIANQSGATFFSISASSLTSKWIGQAEKMVRALFAVANLHQPAVIFIDEIDSLLSQRSDSEHESSRRIKTEFFVQLDGATTSSEDRILVVGATNRPQEIDEAARRRLVKRLYIPLPDSGAREQIISKLMKQQPCMMTRSEIADVVAQTDGYSGADVTNLCKDAALGPIRSLQTLDISKIHEDDVRPINVQDFHKSLQRVKASVSQSDLLQYQEWNKVYGCGAF